MKKITLLLCLIAAFLLVQSTNVFACNPTDPDYPPWWTLYDDLPEGLLRRSLTEGAGRASQRDSIARIPGDSLDINFPSNRGRLVLRLGLDAGVLRGRAVWVVRRDQAFSNEGVFVVASPSTCDGLERSLVRIRDD